MSARENGRDDERDREMLENLIPNLKCCVLCAPPPSM